eukprot:NODE_4632_length_765_cov_7.824451_g4609_i0.p2 GENE.NODE_4632_length_765_cov_7.824451_g4609_i0~~NODE_4632_length_765_cov_7.824451_g4609_i0.p2  ORF type:complete len:107 (-),score=3.11 NODE_4632_length_765_cov_7.824451_g4609_i0:221-541(-)
MFCGALTVLCSILALYLPPPPPQYQLTGCVSVECGRAHACMTSSAVQHRTGRMVRAAARSTSHRERDCLPEMRPWKAAPHLLVWLSRFSWRSRAVGVCDSQTLAVA